MKVGELVTLCCSQTTGYEDGQVGLIVKVEELGSLFNIYWVLMPDGNEVPMWDIEFEVLNGEGRPDNSDGGSS